MEQFSHFIDGECKNSSGGNWIDSYNPYTGDAWAQIPDGDATDADLAVQSAKRAFSEGPWSKMNASERGRIMARVGDLLAEHCEMLAEIEVRDNGKLMAETRGQIKYSSDYWHYYAGLADKIEGSVMPIEKAEMVGMTSKVPVGVVLAITAWNSPLNFFALKCAPALAAGCTVVVKPSEFSSASSLAFAALLEKAGLPAGVINVVSGYGKDIGAALVEHPDVAHVTFTGSDTTGRHIYASAARYMKRVTMELGGKSPNIVFEDADLDAASAGVVSGIFGAGGQMCTAGSRLLVQNSVKEAFTARVVDAARSIKLGDPRDPDTQMGPMSNAPQLDKSLKYIEIARSEGARCILGGSPASGPQIKGGHFVEPTIFTDVTNDMRIAREEVFGPILSIIGFEDEDEAIAIANDTPYGLAAGVWTSDTGRIFRVSNALNVGIVWANTYRTYSYTMPIGGMKQSGLGRENGLDSINEFLETKSLIIYTSSAAPENNFVPR